MQSAGLSKCKAWTQVTVPDLQVTMNTKQTVKGKDYIEDEEKKRGYETVKDSRRKNRKKSQ